MAYGVHYFTQLGPPTCYSRDRQDYVILLKPLRWEHVFCMCSSMWHTLYVWCSFFYCYLIAASKELCSICA